MIQDMEASVSRREVISTRGEAQSKADKKHITKSDFHRKKQELRKKISETQKVSKGCRSLCSLYVPCTEHQCELSTGTWGVRTQTLEGDTTAVHCCHPCTGTGFGNSLGKKSSGKIVKEAAELKNQYLLFPSLSFTRTPRTATKPSWSWRAPKHPLVPPSQKSSKNCSGCRLSLMAWIQRQNIFSRGSSG